MCFVSYYPSISSHEQEEADVAIAEIKDLGIGVVGNPPSDDPGLPGLSFSGKWYDGLEGILRFLSEVKTNPETLFRMEKTP